MKDINGIEIKVGDKVKSQQPSGGVLNPAPAEIGTVFMYKLSWGKEELAIRFKKKGRNYHNVILLEGKINEVVG